MTASAHRRHRSTFGHDAPLSLHADILVGDGSIGIPGITKTYEGELTNLGFFPVPVARCEYLDDTLTPGTMVAYRIERWNQSSARWDLVLDMNGPEFCKPYPLGIVQARLTTKWLWPGQSLRTGDEATAARDGIEKGDSVRFALYLHTGDRNSAAHPTPKFLIDEAPTVDANALRVRH
ncbi:MAG TPA: hypothetical protein VKE70_05060 [Candidatus Solibacter sp.]|nr:hypothetical protein [Candidatus Solibacter sp.]